jgi:hypothetical protein
MISVRGKVGNGGNEVLIGDDIAFTARHGTFFEGHEVITDVFIICTQTHSLQHFEQLFEIKRLAIIDENNALVQSS